MAIKWKYRGELYTFDTAEEAAQMRALLKGQERESERELARARFWVKHAANVLEGHEALMRLEALEAQTPWTPDTFISFMDRLGDPQQAVLAALVRQHRITDEELRKVVNVSDNQALAGVLSGISKQAAALDIPARAVFSFENFRNAGKRRSTYSISDKFLQIAKDMNWPPFSLSE